MCRSLYLPVDVAFRSATSARAAPSSPRWAIPRRGGVQFALPYYWNIAPQRGPHVRADPVLLAAWRRPDAARRAISREHLNTPRSRFSYLPNDELMHSDRSRFSLPERSRSCRATCASSSMPTTVSDSKLFRRFRAGPRRHQRRLRRADSVKLRYPRRALARAARSSSSSRPSTRAISPQVDRPYARLPRIAASARTTAGVRKSAVRYGFDAEVVNFDRDVGDTGWRLDAMPGGLAGLLGGRACSSAPASRFRYTQYSLDLDDRSGNLRENPDALPAHRKPRRGNDLRARSRLPRPARASPSEPRLLYLNVPYPRAGRSAAVRHRRAGPESRPAVPHATATSAPTA